MAPPPEIAIPSTSVSDEGASKPYTLYNITLRLPLRSFVVQKRYSDFAKLHATLTEQAGLPPPEPLPAKHWLKSTVNSPELTNERKVGLERYLKSIAESPDRRWRDTSAWRAFLNLPSSSTTNSTVSAGGRANNVASGTADPITWLDVHKELKQCLHDARMALARRDGAATSGSTTGAAEAATAARKALTKSGTHIINLTEGLRKMQEFNRLGDGEIHRRRDMISTAKMERDGLDKLANSMPSAVTAARDAMGTKSVQSDRAGLLRGGRPAGRTLGAPLPETAKTRELDNEGVLLLQKKEIDQQDQHLNELAAIIRRQKEMGMQINEEVERQTEMLDHIDADVDRVGGKVKVANNRIRKM